MAPVNATLAGGQAGSSKNAKARKRSPSPERDRKRPRVENAQSRAGYAQPCNLKECNSYDKKMDQKADTAMDYLYALDASHKLFDQNVEEVLDWAGDENHFLTTIHDPLDHMIAHADQKGKGHKGSQKHGQVVPRLLEGWAKRVLQQLASALDINEGVDLASKAKTFTAYEESEKYKIELNITPIHRIDETEAEDDGDDGEDGEKIANNNQPITHGIQYAMARSMIRQQPQQRDDDEAGSDENGEEDHEDSRVIMGDETSSTAVVPSKSRLRGNEAPARPASRAQPFLLSDTTITKFKQHSYPNRAVVFNLPSFRNHVGKSKVYMTNPGPWIDRAVRTSLNRQLGKSKVVAVDHFLPGQWVVTLKTINAATKASGHVVDYYGYKVQLQSFTQKTSSVYICQNVPNEIKKPSTRRRLLRLFPDHRISLRWLELEGSSTSGASNGRFVALFAEEMDVKEFSLLLRLPTEQLFRATFRAWEHDRNCAGCGDGGHTSVHCPRSTDVD